MKIKDILFILACLFIIAGLFVPPLWGDNISESLNSVLLIGFIISFIFIVTTLFIDRSKIKSQKNNTAPVVTSSIWPALAWIIFSLVLILNPLWLMPFFKNCNVEGAENGFTFLFGCILGLYGAIGGFLIILGFIPLGKGIAGIIVHIRNKKK